MPRDGALFCHFGKQGCDPKKSRRRCLNMMLLSAKVSPLVAPLEVHNKMRWWQARSRIRLSNHRSHGWYLQQRHDRRTGAGMREQAPHELAAFERPPDAYIKPFETLLPIMARFPRIDEDEVDQQSEDDGSYLQPRAGVAIPGTLPYSPSRNGVTYTHARLPRLDSTARELWTALHSFRPLTTDYAGDFSPRRKQKAPHPVANNASITECPFAATRSPASHSALDLVRRVFNWSAIQLPADSSGTFYGVVFRSKRAAGSESTNLYSADRAAHEEAVAAGGLLMYFYGAPDAVTGTNLATCIWTSRADAIAASALPLHALAVAHARKAYESFELSRYRVVKREGETGVSVEAWE
ncbi:hypothetical protein FH972_022824 [Carpinus fangiana]|uniref:Uncharacterized protein n=1 Tax=Carpinus fangiana TaxID=176857 RepID=A0A5N6KTC7_9ROSI|nr:hypothetical protein FH972_022824 [Carpinus fangiana]